MDIPWAYTGAIGCIGLSNGFAITICCWKSVFETSHGKNLCFYYILLTVCSNSTSRLVG